VIIMSGKVNRRDWLKVMAGTAGGLVVGAAGGYFSRGAQSMVETVTTTKTETVSGEMTGQNGLIWNPRTAYTSYLGFDPTPYAKVIEMVTDADKEQVKTMNLKVAIQLQSIAEDWSQLQNFGIRDICNQLGIKVVTTGWAEWDPSKEINLVESMIALKPDYLFTISSDPDATKDVYKRAADAGIKLVIMDVAVPGLSYPDQMVGVTACDPVGLGVAAGDIMARALDYQGKVVTLDWGIDFFVTNKREEGFRKNLALYPDMEIVGRETFPDPNKVGDVVEALLPRYPDLDGLFVTWTEPPAMDAITAARTLGRTKLVVTSCDLSERTAIQIAKAEGPVLAGVAAQYPYLQGVVETHQMVLDAVGKTVPPYALVAPVMVTQSNLIDAWNAVESPWAAKPPQEAIDALKSKYCQA
jgi:ribose transport system substrate-binding protein